MNILFVHQNFPRQFKQLAPVPARARQKVLALARDGAGLPEIPMARYDLAAQCLIKQVDVIERFAAGRAMA